jgi:hypothetical protein
MLDLISDKQIIVYDEKAEQLEDTPAVTSLRWTNNSTLRIGTAVASDLPNERIRIWKA